MPQVDGDPVKIGMGMAPMMAMAPMGGMDFNKSANSIDRMNGPVYQEGTWGMMNQPTASGFYSEFESRESGVGADFYDGMALPDHFLEEYYTQVRINSNNSTLSFLLPIASFCRPGHNVLIVILMVFKCWVKKITPPFSISTESGQWK